MRARTERVARALDLGGIRLPLDAITQTFGILAVRGAGKSNTAAAMAEEMFAAGLPFVVIDPVGSWFGLRSAADGQGPGLQVPIFGGEHGDVPLERTGGALVADLVVDQRLSLILDVSEFSKGDRIRFLTDFAERLYRRNRDPLHLFLEEADDFIPQRPFRDEARCLAAWETIVRRGRSRGLGITMITQRSAALNKNVLTQTETLIVLRITSPQDRKAIEAWVEYHGQADELLESLSGLNAGEAWIWSPHWLKAVKRIQVRRRRTFDSGATPKDVRGKRPPATLADVDLRQITTQMAATIERAKADDPKEIRKQLSQAQAAVRALETQLAQARAAPPAAPVERPVPVSVVTPEMVVRLQTSIDRAFDLAREVQAIGTAIFAEAKGALEQIQRSSRVGQPAPLPVRSVTRAQTPPTARVVMTAPAEGLTRPQQAILDTVAMLNARGITPTRDTVARWLGIHPNGGSYGANLGTLRSSGYLDGFVLTDAGLAAAAPPATGIDAALAALQDEPKRKIIRTLLDVGHPLTRDELAAQLAIHPNGGSYGANLGWLRTMGLITDRGPIAVTEGARR